MPINFTNYTKISVTESEPMLQGLTRPDTPATRSGHPAHLLLRAVFTSLGRCGCVLWPSNIVPFKNTKTPLSHIFLDKICVLCDSESKEIFCSVVYLMYSDVA